MVSAKSASLFLAKWLLLNKSPTCCRVVSLTAKAATTSVLCPPEEEAGPPLPGAMIHRRRWEVSVNSRSQPPLPILLGHLLPVVKTGDGRLFRDLRRFHCLRQVQQRHFRPKKNEACYEEKWCQTDSMCSLRIPPRSLNLVERWWPRLFCRDCTASGHHPLILLQLPLTGVTSLQFHQLWVTTLCLDRGP